MTPSEDIIDKIRKLLRLAQGSTNPHEAGIALERALRLAARHKIDVAGLDLDPEIERIIHQRFPAGERLSYIKKQTLNVVVAFFHVDVVLWKPDVIFAGTATDVTIAHYIFGFLSGTCARALHAFEHEKKRKPSRIRRENFVAGWIWGICHQLSGAQEALAVEDSKFALALADQKRRREAYLDALTPNTKTVVTKEPRRHRTAATAGYIEGRATNIRTPLNPAPEVLRLTPR